VTRRFRDPETNQSSDSAFRSQRTAAFACAAVLAGMAVRTFRLAATTA
jgi:hypothetical protein